MINLVRGCASATVFCPDVYGIIEGCGILISFEAYVGSFRVKADYSTRASIHPDGVVIGMLLGIENGRPLVVFPSNPEETAIPARATVALTPADIGSEVALLFEDGDPGRPLIIGRVVEHVASDPSKQVIRDGEVVRVKAEERLELRCGKASIIMESDGRVTIRGSKLVSQSSGANLIRGGAVKLN